MRLLVTGFGPYLDNDENPSATLAKASCHPHVILEVSYSAVDEFVTTLDRESFDAWLALGLATKAETMLMETVARNSICAIPDERGEVWGPGPIDPAGPPALGATLWHSAWVEGDEVKASVDAGGYLCNYVLYRALRAFPEKRIGFLHVPPFSQVPFERQVEVLCSVIEDVL